MPLFPAKPSLDVATPAAARAAAGGVVDFRLDNGLTVVVIPDRRAPVVTHMVWYRNGSADDPQGKSGIAHFLEHLMFKGTKAHPQGEFSKLIAEIGGQENAFTGNDYTAYFQRVAKEHLAELMEFEADRMTGLTLTDEVVTPERDVVLEERRMHCDADPGAQLNEAVQATLFTHHPYGMPIIGWAHEIEGLSREDALAYYARFYTPENAILIVAGDVDPAETRVLAERYLRPGPPARRRAEAQPPEGAGAGRAPPRLVNDEKVEQPSWQRCYLAPSYRTAAPGEAEALEVLAHLLGGGQTACSIASWCWTRRRRSPPAPITWARRSTTRASSSTPCPPPASPCRISTRRSIAALAGSSPTASTRPSSSAPRPASSPRRSTPRTARSRSRAGTARRSPPARRSATSRNGRQRIEAVRRRGRDRPPRANGSIRRRAVTGYLLPTEQTDGGLRAADARAAAARSGAPEETLDEHTRLQSGRVERGQLQRPRHSARRRRSGWSKITRCRWWRSNSPSAAARRRTPPARPGAATMLAGLLDEGAGDLDVQAFQQALDEKAIELSFNCDRDHIERAACAR